MVAHSKTYAILTRLVTQKPVVSAVSPGDDVWSTNFVQGEAQVISVHVTPLVTTTDEGRITI